MFVNYLKLLAGKRTFIAADTFIGTDAVARSCTGTWIFYRYLKICLHLVAPNSISNLLPELVILSDNKEMMGCGADPDRATPPNETGDASTSDRSE